MRVGFDGKRALNNSSGLGNYSRSMIASVSKLLTNDIFVYTPKSQRLYEVIIGNIEGVTIRYPAFRNKLNAIWWRTFGINTDFLKDGIEVFHGLSNELPIGIPRHIRTIVTIHDLIFLRYPKLYKPIDRAIYSKKFFRSANEADVVIAISQQTKRDLIDYFGIDSKKIQVVYQDCDQQFHRDLPSEELKIVKEKYQLPDQYLLSVGTIEPRKNQKLIVEAMLNIEDIPLVLVGRETSYQKEIVLFARKNNLEHRLKIINNVDFRDLPHIFNQAIVFVYPSIFEGFGIPIIEAQNQDVPVVTSEGSCFQETGGEAALYGSSENPQELARNVNLLLSDSVLHQSKVGQGKDNVMRFRAENTIGQIEKIYKGA